MYHKILAVPVGIRETVSTVHNRFILYFPPKIRTLRAVRHFYDVYTPVVMSVLGLNFKAPAGSFTSKLSKIMQFQDAILVPLHSYFWNQR